MRSCCFVVFLTMLCAMPSMGAEHWVAPNGSDSALGTSLKPWKSIEHAASAIKPGDTVTIRAGIYRAKQFGFGPAGGGKRTMTVFRAAKGERVLLTQEDGLPPGVHLDDYVRLEGLWIGGKWAKQEGLPIFGVGGSPIGRGKELIDCTIFGYADGILVGSSEDLLIRGNRIIHCGMGRFCHGVYLSGGYNKGQMTQHVVVDGNVFIGGEGYGIHGWHNPHSCIITRNFVSGHFWGLVMSGSDHIIAHNTLWRHSGQKGAEPAWNAWLPGERMIVADNILNEKIAIYDAPGAGCTVSHNAYLSAAPSPADTHPLNLRPGSIDTAKRAALDKWITDIDAAMQQIDEALDQPVEKLFENRKTEAAFTTLQTRPPESSGLRSAGRDTDAILAGKPKDMGWTAGPASDYWKAFDALGLMHYDSSGEKRR